MIAASMLSGSLNCPPKLAGRLKLVGDERLPEECVRLVHAAIANDFVRTTVV